MSNAVIECRNLSKRYRLGAITRHTLADELKWAWARLSGRDPLLSVGAIGKRAAREGVHVALDQVSFQINPGETVGLIGHNGAGKSTLLKLLSRITDPTAGEAFLRGRVGSLLEVGTGFHPDLTGRENIFMSGVLLGMRKHEVRSRFDEIVDFSGVEAFIDTPVKRYSSGMFVRLAFAVAAHLEAEILLVDEVLAVGDAEFQRKCLGKMDHVARSGRTIIFVSHNLSSIRNLCTRGMVLRRGRLAFDGPTSEAIAHYARAYAEDVPMGCYRAAQEGPAGRDSWIDEIHLERNGKPVTTCISGEDMDLVLRYRSRIAGIPLYASFAIYDETHQKLVQFGQHYRQPDGTPANPEGCIRCHIPRLPLMAGRYKINAALHARGIIIDHVPDAFWFEIEPGNFFGSGFLPNPSETRFLVDQHWQVES